LQLLLDSSHQVQKQDVDDFRRLFWAAQYCAAANKARQSGLLELAAKQLTAVLRFIGIVPADRCAVWMNCVDELRG
jgi:hypothetical protein